MQEDLCFTALMCACQEGHADVVDLLIESGAAVDYHNKVGVECLLGSCYPPSSSNHT